MFGFLAGVRGTLLKPLATKRGRTPEYKPEMECAFGGFDVPVKENEDRHSHSYLFDHELLDFDYTTKTSEGKTYAEELGPKFMSHLAILRELPMRWRIIFEFDC